MFNTNGNEKQLAESLHIKIENVEEFLKRMAGFLNGRKIISKRNIADAFFILQEMQQKEQAEEIKQLRAAIKNPILLKYKEKIIELYKSGYGYVRISKILKVDHNVTISKSTIERFIKKQEVKKYG
ncbi:MAG: hypothetical protein LGB66_05300 [Sulfurovum sp.]|nr:hypothetical protein [Sulfurovum sp.]